MTASGDERDEWAHPGEYWNSGLQHPSGYGQITLSNINFKKLLAVGATPRDWTTVMPLQTAPV